MADSSSDTLARDARLDSVGYVAELEKQFADPLKKRIKSALLDKSIARAAGDAFEGLIVAATTTAIDAEKFLRLYERGKLTRAQFLAAVSVRKDAALDAMSRDELAKISTESPATPRLVISRIKGVEFALVDALNSIRTAIG